MLKIEDYKKIFLLASLIGSLIIASPAITYVLPSWPSESFSELYVLGPDRVAEDYPYDLMANEEYKIYLGIGNHIGSSAYYVLYVKLGNRSDLLPNSTAPSPLPPLYEYRVFLRDDEVWEDPLTFSLNSVSFFDDSCLVNSMTLNGVTFYVNKVNLWDFENEGFFFRLFFELWIYDPDTKGFSFHSRFIGIPINVTA